MNAKIKRSMTLTITGATRDMHDKVLDHTLHNLLHTQSDDGKKNHTKLKSDNTNRKERKSNAKKKEKGGGRIEGRCQVQRSVQDWGEVQSRDQD